MDSDSDWDSLTAEAPAVTAGSIADKLPTNNGDLSPRPPTYDKVIQPGGYKHTTPVSSSPVPKGTSVRSSTVETPPGSKQNSTTKAASRVAESYRRSQPHSVTVFRDTRDTGLKSETGSKTSKSGYKFNEVELEDKSEYEAGKGGTIKPGKSQLPANLPYTNFQAVTHDYNQNRVNNQGRVAQPIKTEYVKKTPEAAESPQQRSRYEAALKQPVKASHDFDDVEVHTSPVQMRQRDLNTNADHKRQSSPPKAKHTQKRVGKSSGLGIRNLGAEIVTDSESDSTDRDVSWGNAMGSVKVDIKESKQKWRKEFVEEEEKKSEFNGERIYYKRMNNDYYSITPPSKAVLPELAKKWQVFIRRGWQEFFGALSILTDFFVLFVVELVRFLTKQFVKVLLVGVLETVSDFVLKPLLAVFYNGVFQPFFTFLWNILNGVKNLLQPFLMVLREFVQQAALLLSSIRLIEINANKKDFLSARDPVEIA